VWRPGWDGPSGDAVGAVRSLLDELGGGDYLGLLAYFHRSDARHQALQRLRAAIRDRRSVATTLGYGPRYLHSTGQLHKGGPNSGVYLVVTADAAGDEPIPGEQYGFATLLRAQALGDFRALAEHRRRVARIHVGGDLEQGLNRLVDQLVAG
jgi:hypothetical protein